MNDTTVIHATEQHLARPTGGSLGIQGLEEEDASILPVPFVRVVQNQSKDTKMKDGKDAPEGQFFFNDTREVVSALTFCILKSKVFVTEMDDISNPGKKKMVTQRRILGITMDTKKVFMLTLSIASFASYGRLIAEIKQRKIPAVWDYMVTATTEKIENDKGKFYVVNFSLGEELTSEDKIEMGLAYEQFRRVFEKQPEEPGLTNAAGDILPVQPANTS